MTNADEDIRSGLDIDEAGTFTGDLGDALDRLKQTLHHRREHFHPDEIQKMLVGVIEDTPAAIIEELSVRMNPRRLDTPGRIIAASVEVLDSLTAKLGGLPGVGDGVPRCAVHTNKARRREGSGRR